MTILRASRAIAVTAATACLAVLTACSSDGDSSSPSSAGNTSPTVASVSPTIVPVTSEAPPSDDLSSALLTPTEIGTGFTLATDQSAGSSALPCTPNDPPLFTQAPPEQKANRNSQSADDDVEVSEVVAVFSDGAAAAKAYKLGSAGFACTAGKLNGTSITIAKRTEGVPAGSSLDDLGAWDFATGDVKATSVLLRSGSKLVGLTFVAKPAAAAAVNVGEITDKAASKAVQAD